MADQQHQLGMPLGKLLEEAKLSTPEEVRNACGVLEEFGWLRFKTAKTGGRSATRLRTHPSLREQA